MKRKIIKLICLLFIIILVFEIYYIAKSEKINYVALGDSFALGINSYGENNYGYTDYLKDYLKNKKRLSYYKNYANDHYTTETLIESIRYKTQIKKDLRESDLVTLSIGINDFYENIDAKSVDSSNLLSLKSNINEIIPNIEMSLREIRKYAKQKIIIIGYYNPVPFLFNISSRDLDELFAYIDENYRNLASKYNCIYISTYQLFKTNSSFLPNPKDIHPNYEGYKEIANLIIKKMN